MMLAIGLCAIGAARVFTSRPGGFVLLGVGLVACAAVRPHIALMLFVALVPSYLLRRGRPGRPAAVVSKLVGAGVLALGGALLASRFSSTFGVSGIGPSSVRAVLTQASQSSSGGASGFTPGPFSFAHLPIGIFSVLFRPLIFEAHNFESLIVGIEGTFLLVFGIASFGRVRRALMQSLSTVYLLFAAAYALVFAAAFASLANYGTLDRQRVQFYPFVLVLLAVPAAAKHRQRASAQLQGG
jgi:hypothetical protein